MDIEFETACQRHLHPEEYKKYGYNVYLFIKYLMYDCATDYRISEDKTEDLKFKHYILLSLIQMCQDQLSHPIQTHNFTEFMDEMHKISKRFAAEYDGTYLHLRGVTESMHIFNQILTMIDRVIKYTPDIDTSF